jgi:hypothetical protein
VEPGSYSLQIDDMEFVFPIWWDNETAAASSPLLFSNPQTPRR